MLCKHFAEYIARLGLKVTIVEPFRTQRCVDAGKNYIESDKVKEATT